MIKEESEIKVRDTSHNAISIGEVGQELYLLTKSLYFPPNYLGIFWNNPPIFLRKVILFSLRILENRWIRTLLLLLFEVDNLSTHFSFISSNFKIYSSFSGMSRLELDSSGSGPGVQAGCHLLPAGPGLGDGGEPPSESPSTRSR